jgi:hypothetical protein
VAILPDPIAAMVRGESAYKSEAGIEIHLLAVNFFNKLKQDHIISSGAIKKNTVIKNWTFPKTTRDAIAVIAIHGGVARDDPIPT